MRNSKVLLAGLLGASLLVVSACSQGDPADSSDGNDNAAEEAEAGGDAEEPSAEAPAPFDDDGVDIAIVQNSGQGDYFQQYLNGTRQQVEALGGELAVYDAQGDNATQTSQLEQAISSSPDGIIVRHGVPDALCSGVNSAIDAGIPVIIYDVEIQECAPDAIQSQQSDAEMASLVLDKMVEDVGSDQDVGYVNVAGIAPLDRRDAVWQDYKSERSEEHTSELQSRGHL